MKISFPLLFLVGLYAYDSRGNEVIKIPACLEAEKADYPSGDRPTDAEKNELQDCKSKNYYYGIGIPRDFEKARKCAFLELGKNEEMFAGEVILMQLYANGEGVSKNLNLALKLACNAGGAPAEQRGRQGHLLSLKTKPGKKPFAYCDDITSGYMMGFCSLIAKEIEDAKRSAELEKLVRSWPEEHQRAFAVLKEAKDKFVKERGGNEVDLSGTARGAMVIAEENRLNRAFEKALREFEQGKLPSFSDKDLARADSQLNSRYKELKGKGKAKWGTVDFEGVQTTQRAWLPYRDAWVSFGAVHYSNVSAQAWKAWATRIRVKQLKELFIE